MNNIEEKATRFSQLIEQQKLGAVVLFRPEELVMSLGYQPLIGMAMAVFFPEHVPILYLAENEPQNRFVGQKPEMRVIATGIGVDFMKDMLQAMVADIQLYGATDGPIGYVKEATQQSPVGLLAEGMPLGVSVFKQLSEYLLLPCVDAAPAIHRLFQKKTSFDVIQLRKVYEVAALAIVDFYSHLQVGATEIDLKSSIEHVVALQANRDDLFMTNAWAFVQTGEHTKKSGCYNVSSNQSFQEGDLVLLEMAICVNGYWCDLTRTGYVGEPTEAVEKLYDVVRGAQHLAIAHLKEGVSAGAIYSLAAGEIEEAGFLYAFPHALGHGVGFRYHDYEPFLLPNQTTQLEAGMVMTIEPGIYGEEIGGGIRIEDNILITKEGHEVLSAAVPTGLKGKTLFK